MAIGYGREVELINIFVDSLNGKVEASHNITLSQDFNVYALAWKDRNRLAVFGDSLALWECTIMNSSDASHGIWMCAFTHGLPSRVIHVCMSPDGKYFATTGEDRKVRVYHLSLAMESYPLKDELSLLLGRSFSQSFDVLGSAPILSHFKLPLHESSGPIRDISWRQTSDDCNALLVGTEDSLLYFIENQSPRYLCNSLFNLHIIQRRNVSLSTCWWLEDRAMCAAVGQAIQLIGEGNSSLLVFGGDSADVFRISNVNEASSAIVAVDRLINISLCLPPLRQIDSIFFRQDTGLFLDHSKSVATVGRLRSTSTPEDTIQFTGDFYYDIVSSSIPLFTDRARTIHVTPFGHLVCAVGELGKCSIFSFEEGNIALVGEELTGVISVISSQKIERFYLFLEQGEIIATGTDGLFRLTETKESLEDWNDFFLFVKNNELYASQVKISVDKQLISFTPLPAQSEQVSLLGENCMHFDFLSCSAGILTFNSGNFQRFPHIQDLKEVACCKAPFDGVFSTQGDYACVDSDNILTFYSPSPISQSLFTTIFIDHLNETPLYLYFSTQRDLFLVFPNCIVKYTVELNEQGNERWSRLATFRWHANFPSTLTIQDSISMALVNGFIILAMDGLIYILKASHFAIRDKDCNHELPGKILAYRFVNAIAHNQFEDFFNVRESQQIVELEAPRAKTLVRRVHSLNPRSDDATGFSFFDDVAFFDTTSNEDEIFNDQKILSEENDASEEQADREISTRSLTPRLSLATSYFGQIGVALTEAVKLLQQTAKGLDNPGRKYLFFAKLSKEFDSSVFDTYGFEMLAARLSDAQELLIDITKLELIEPLRTWENFVRAGMGFWVKNEQKLKQLLEEVARVDFSQNMRTEPANSAILYVILGRTSLLKALWRDCRSFEECKMLSFLDKDFSDEKVKSIAAKNAFAALSKQKIRLALFFFLLASRLDDAIQVCFDRLHDYHLGYLIIRFLHDSKGYRMAIEKYVSRNLSIPICLRSLMKKELTQDVPWLSLIVSEPDFEEIASKSGLCLPLAVASLKEKGTMDSELIPQAIQQLCSSGCYQIASLLCELNNINIAPLVEVWNRRWPSSYSNFGVDIQLNEMI